MPICMGGVAVEDANTALTLIDILLEVVVMTVSCGVGCLFPLVTKSATSGSKNM